MMGRSAQTKAAAFRPAASAVVPTLMIDPLTPKPLAREPLAVALFVCEMNVAGLLEAIFRVPD